MEPHEFTHDFMWKHTDFKWCRRQSHRGEICLPLSSQVLLQLKSYIFHIYMIIFPLWANACLNSIWKTKLWLKQYNGKLKTASSFSAVALQLECVLHSPDPKDESTLCLTAWAPSWSLRGGRKAGTHATSPLGIGWCPLTDWGCKDVFTFVYCVRLRVLH